MKLMAEKSFPSTGMVELNGCKIHYSVTILNEVGSALVRRITGWVFDPESPAREIALEIAGKNAYHKFVPTMRRNDVYTHFNIPHNEFASAASCGYEISIPLSTTDGANKISVSTKDGTIELGEIHPYKRKLIVGKGNWLF